MIPKSIAIIMDGNGRWATERGKDRSYGHQAGGYRQTYHLRMHALRSEIPHALHFLYGELEQAPDGDPCPHGSRPDKS